MNLSMIVPIFNEEKNIVILYKELVHVLEGMDQEFEIIFIDDGSDDRTLRRLKEIKTDQRATIISINSLVLNLSAIVLVTGFGILSRIGDLIWGFILFALLLILFSIISIVFSKNK